VRHLQFVVSGCAFFDGIVAVGEEALWMDSAAQF
jgi:hypothetical protein